MLLTYATAACVMLFTATAVALDLRSRTLTNWLTVPAFVSAVMFHCITGGLTGLGQSLAGFAVGFGILLVLWLIGGGGGGDVKLMGAIGAWLGPALTLVVFLSTSVVTVGVVIFVFVWKILTRSRHVENPVGKVKNERTLPYAVPVAVAVWGVMILKIIAVSAK